MVFVCGGACCGGGGPHNENHFRVAWGCGWGGKTSFGWEWEIFSRSNYHSQEGGGLEWLV